MSHHVMVLVCTPHSPDVSLLDVGYLAGRRLQRTQSSTASSGSKSYGKISNNNALQDVLL